MVSDPLAPDEVDIRVPTRFAIGADGLADHCGWDVLDTTGEVSRMRQKGGFGGGILELIRLVPVTDAAGAGRSQNYSAASGAPQDYLDPSGQRWEQARAEVERVAASGALTDFFYALDLLVLSAPDVEFTAHLQSMFQQLALSLSRASLWFVPFHPWLIPRRSVIGTLFNAYEAPELLQQTPDSFRELEAGRGLGGVTGLTVAPLVQPLMLAASPWLHGVVCARASGLLVVSFGEPLRGHIPPHGAELLERFRQQLLWKPVHPYPRPEFDAADTTETLRWWITRANELLTIALDPANHRDSAGRYDAAGHFGSVVSIDRLFAAINTLLVSSERDPYTALEMLFISLDLLDGLTGRDYRYLLSARRCSALIAQLEMALPPAANKVLLPRCRRGLCALTELRQGFFLPERSSGENLRLKRAGADTEHDVPLDEAVADYLRLVRNGAHSLRAIMADPRHRSLLSSHNGWIPPAVTDIAFLHLVYLLSKPGQLFPGRYLTRGRSAASEDASG